MEQILYINKLCGAPLINNKDTWNKQTQRQNFSLWERR